MLKLKKRKPKNRRKFQEEKLKFQGALGGEVSILPTNYESEQGFGDLESAKEYIEKDFKPWNSEEEEMMREVELSIKKSV